MTAGTALAPRLQLLLEMPPRRVRRTVFCVLALPFVIAAIVLSTRHWYPVLDMAMTELRVRDAFGRHSPLIGLPGRIGHFPEQGSHPGPLSFYVLAPFYRVVGSSAFGLLLGMIVLDLVAIAVALWIAERRGGTRFVLAVGGILAVLLHGYGMGVLTQPWNPYLPLLSWIVVLLGAWSVFLGDHAMIVVVAGFGSLCAQTHVPYVGLCAGMGGLSIAWLVVEAIRHPVKRNELQRAGARAVVLTAVLWSPVVVDQVRRTPGNLSMLSDYFRHPAQDPVGLGEGLRLVLRHLNVFRVIDASVGVAGRSGGGFMELGFDLTGSVVPGVFVLLVWFGSIAVAARMRHRSLLALDAALGAALVLATISMGRIFGKVWYYLTLWAWSITVLVLASIVWTAYAWVGSRRPHGDARDDQVEAVAPAGAPGWNTTRRWHLRRSAAVLGAIITVGTYVPLVIDGAQADVPEAHLSTTLRALVDPTASALDAGIGDATGRDGTYLVVFNDSMYFGSQAYGLVSELERRGFDAGMTSTYRVPITPRRVVAETTATAVVVLATGGYIAQWRAVAGAVEVAHVEPGADAVAESSVLDAEVRAGLTTAGLGDLVALIDTNLFGVQLDERVPANLQAKVSRLLVLGRPESVFIVPTGSPNPT